MFLSLISSFHCAAGKRFLLTAWCQQASATLMIFEWTIMRRADRLLQIIQVLRRRKASTTARMLADELEVTSRTIYRDIVTLQSARVPIEGEAGLGYILRGGYDLPPLMFSADEIDAVMLGMQMVLARGDADLARSASNVLAKIEAVVPDDVSDQMWKSALLVPHSVQTEMPFARYLPMIRLAVRQNHKLMIVYTSLADQETARTIWPLGLYIFSHVTLLCAWCELREGYRAFRAERITQCEPLADRFNPKNGAMMTEFLKQFAQR
jgi:predicted DNA-binding transcriptional regulator YafY